MTAATSIYGRPRTAKVNNEQLRAAGTNLIAGVSLGSRRLCASRLAQCVVGRGEAMDALLERRAALRAALAEVGREKKKIKRAQVKEAKVWVLTPFLKSVVLIAYVLAGYTADPAARYLATVARKRGWPDKSEGDLMREAEEVFLACDEDELAALTCLGNPSNPEAAKAAVRVVEEWRLAQWVLRLNEQQGVAPSTALVLERREQAFSHLPEDVRPPYIGTEAEARARMWARRWRLRWGARHGRIRVREDVPLEERRAKVARQKLSPQLPSQARRALEIRPRPGPKYCPNIDFRFRNPASFLHPESGVENEAGIQPLNKDSYVTAGIRLPNLSRIPGAKRGRNPASKTTPESSRAIKISIWRPESGIEI